MSGGYHHRSVREDAGRARDHADRNLAEELRRSRNTGRPTTRPGMVGDWTESVPAH